MNKSVKFAFVSVLALLAAGCSTATKEKIGLAKKAPNEFMVAPRAPLSVPPEYNLRPVAEPQNGEYEAEVSGLSVAETRLLKQVEAQ